MKNLNNKLLGLALLAITALWLLDAFAYINGEIILLLLGVFFGGLFLNGLKQKEIFSSAIFLTLSYHFTSISGILPLPTFSFWKLMVSTFLILLALNLLGFNSPLRFGKGDNVIKFSLSDEKKHNTDVHYEEDTLVAKINTLLGENIRYIHSKKTRDVYVSNLLGTTTVYFQEKEPEHKNINLHISNTFGDVTIYIPYGWKVVGQPNLTMGEFKYSPSNDTENEYTVHLSGSLLMSEASIRYF